MLEVLKTTYFKLCAPAKFYLVVSIFSFLFMFIQNLGNDQIFCFFIFKQTKNLFKQNVKR